MSADSRRVSFIADKVAYAALEKIAQDSRISVGELIRRAIEKEYQLTPGHPIVQIRVPPSRRRLPKEQKKPSSKKAKTK